MVDFVAVPHFLISHFHVHYHEHCDVLQNFKIFKCFHFSIAPSIVYVILIYILLFNLLSFGIKLFYPNKLLHMLIFHLFLSVKIVYNTVKFNKIGLHIFTWLRTMLDPEKEAHVRKRCWIVGKNWQIVP